MAKLPTKVLHGIGNDLVNEIVRGLGKHFDSGQLSNSISYQILDDGRITITMSEHWKYVEYGTPGVKKAAISTVNGITTSLAPNPFRKMPVFKSGETFINYISGDENFALAKHIQMYGTRPYPFVRPVLYSKLQDIIKNNIQRHMYGNA